MICYFVEKEVSVSHKGAILAFQYFTLRTEMFFKIQGQTFLRMRLYLYPFK